MADKLIYGLPAIGFAKEEETFDTFQALAAGDAIDFVDLKIEPTIDTREVKSHRGSCSQTTMILGRKGGKYNATFNLTTCAAGSAPTCGVLLEAAMGAAAVSAGTSVTYTLTDSDPITFQLSRASEAKLLEHANGCWVEQMDLDVKGNAEPTLAFSGGFASHLHGYACEVGAGGAAAEATSVPVAAGHAGALSVGMVVNIGASTGHTISAVHATTGALTVSPGLASTVEAGDAIVPVVPTPTYAAGTLLDGLDGTVTIDTVEHVYTAFKLSLKTGLHGLDKIATHDKAVGVSHGKREVTGELQLYMKTGSVAAILGKTKEGATHALVIQIGQDVAGKSMTVSIPKAFFEIVPTELPESEEALVNFKFRALMNSASGDELSILFD